MKRNESEEMGQNLKLTQGCVWPAWLKGQPERLGSGEGDKVGVRAQLTSVSIREIRG